MDQYLVSPSILLRPSPPPAGYNRTSDGLRGFEFHFPTQALNEEKDGQHTCQSFNPDSQERHPYQTYPHLYNSGHPGSLDFSAPLHLERCLSLEHECQRNQHSSSYSSYNSLQILGAESSMSLTDTYSPYAFHLHPQSDALFSAHQHQGSEAAQEVSGTSMEKEMPTQLSPSLRRVGGRPSCT